jgi:hypothetical protein
LVCEEEDCFEGEFAIAKVEEVFERGTKEIENHGILRISIVKESRKIRNRTQCQTNGQRESRLPQQEPVINITTRSTLYLVDSRLIFQLRMLGLCRLKLDGDFFSRDDVRP